MPKSFLHDTNKHGTSTQMGFMCFLLGSEGITRVLCSYFMSSVNRTDTVPSPDWSTMYHKPQLVSCPHACSALCPRWMSVIIYLPPGVCLGCRDLFQGRHRQGASIESHQPLTHTGCGGDGCCCCCYTRVVNDELRQLFVTGSSVGAES